jgi:single-stranded-DNA-specific exonuclease
MIAVNEGIGAGSARSIAGFHLAAAFNACSSHLLSHGGHEMAAGCKLKAASVEAFREAFCAHAKSLLKPEHLIPQITLDAVAELGHINQSLVNDLARLGPFGNGNRKPLLCCRNLTVAQAPRRVGKTGDHLQLFLRQGSASMKAIAFNSGQWFDRLTPGTAIDLACEPTINEWNGRISVELEVKDLQIQ